MPSNNDLPTLPELLGAFEAEVHARNPLADTHRGSGYDIFAGIGALLWLREAGRDRSLFRGVYLDTCEERDLDRRIQRFGGPERRRLSRGQGTAIVSRSSLAGGAGTFWAGTRIGVSSPLGAAKFYRMASDTAVPPNVLSIHLPIEAEDFGPGAAIDTTGKPLRIWWEDLVWDPGWTIQTLVCQDGSAEETDPAYRARYRQDKLSRRKGYAASIVEACKQAGASNVALFESDFAEPDRAISRCFVSDASLAAPFELLQRCRLAVDSARVFGCELTVWGMRRTLCRFDLTLKLPRDPALCDRTALLEETRRAVMRAFSGSSTPYVFSRDAVRAEIARAMPEASDVIFGPQCPVDTAIVSLLEATMLDRFYTETSAIRVRFQGPT